ncbi:MAG TPA: sugar phosphate isomerase/epimerase [Phycisphaerae bacterium]|nr:sugar phosphate isomerase/epimerase [Phycisphaerae bacterium]
MRIGCQIGMWKGDEPFEEKVAAVGRTGAAGVEVFTHHFEPYANRPAGFKALVDAAGPALTGAYFNSADFLNTDAEGAVVARAAQDCRFLHAAGGAFLLVNGGLWHGDDQREYTDGQFAQLAKVANRIGDAAAAAGIQAVIHPHWKCQVETPADLDRLVAAGLDWRKVGLCVHAAHQYLAGADPYEIYEKHAAHVRYVHVGDSDGDRKACPLGRGALDQRRLMQPLLEAGFDGWVIIECTCQGVPPADYAAEAMEYLRTTWPTVSWDG